MICKDFNINKPCNVCKYNLLPPHVCVTTEILSKLAHIFYGSSSKQIRNHLLRLIDNDHHYMYDTKLSTVLKYFIKINYPEYSQCLENILLLK